MFVGRVQELDAIRRILESSRDESGGSSIISCHGIFGAGKTTLLRRVREMVEHEGLVDAVLATNEDITPATLPEFVYALAAGFESYDPEVFRLVLDETDARRRRYLQIAGQLGVDMLPILQRLRSDPASEARYGARQIEGDTLALEVAVKSQFNNRDDQRLTLDTGNVVAEALIVDLMTTFFPLQQGNGLDSHIPTGSPRRILVIIDTFEKISALVGPWLLESLLPYVFTRRFGDFQSYRTPFLPDRVHVRDFFDIRLLVAGRERLSLTDSERRWDRYRDQMTELRVGSFTHDELSTYLQQNGFDAEKHVEDVLQLTQGLPYLASLWVDAARAEHSGATGTFLSALAEDRIFWYKDAEQRDWIRAAAFLDWFDADALHCFSAIGENAPRAFEYLRNSSELARPSASVEGKFELHEIIRIALRAATQQESSDRAIDYRESAAAFYGASALLSRFATQERRTLRRLAYFAHIDETAIADYFGGEAHLVRALIADAPDLFVRSGNGWALEPEAAQRLSRYNRRADRTDYTATVEEIRQLWRHRSGQIAADIAARRRESQGNAERLRELRSQVDSGEELHSRASADLRELEADLQRARSRWHHRLSPRETLVARASFFLLVISLLIIFFAELIPVDERTQSLVRTAALLVAALFLLVFSLSLGRVLYMKSRRLEHAALRDDVSSIEGRLAAARREARGLNTELESARTEIDALTASQTQLASETAALAEASTRPYV